MMRRPLLIVALLAVLDAAIYAIATRTGFGRTADLRVLDGFVGLWQLPLPDGAVDVAHLFNPLPYAVLVCGICAAGVVGGRARDGIVAAVMMVGASASSQILKPLLAVQRDY